MSVQEAGGSEEPVHILTVHMSPSLDTAQRCNVRVRRHTTATLVLENLVKHFHLDKARNYELVEVREPGAGARALQAGERPVEHMLLWPQGHEQSRGFYFTLQEGQRDTMKDLCGLAALNEKNVLEALRRRFYSKQIYTYAGDILLAINPFQFLPIYNPKDVEMYQNRALGQKEPHVFAVADAAFHAMLSKRTNQCIVISGESGSGKTQSTKFIIHCLTALSRKGCTSGVERTILGAGPVLEAFGNAKTSYNNNSSRFGKFIRVNFLEGGVVRGATIETYLLEKSRLVTRRSSERNYHVFYYLLLGATQEEREEFRLLEPEQYHYLKQDDPQLEDEVVMKDEFKRLHQAMELVGFLPPTRKQILSVLSAILYLGNVTYTTKPGGDGVTVGPPDVLQTLSDLLKVKVELLATALTKRKAMTANDVLILPYTLSQAVTARDSVAKSLYSSMFDWIVLRINHALLNKRDVEEAVPCLSIGVLDIFGFEDVRSNSFEQFCINYANEQLQHYCTQHIFRLEQEEYGAEGISWTPVDYCDNEGCISLVSKKPTGLLYLLDEESSLPQATDATLLEKFKQQHQENRFFVPTPVLEPAFIIRHYAGKVKYQIEDFRAKNTDHMRPDIVSLLRGSQSAYLRRLMGSNPVAVFRWGILRAVVRIVNTFKTAGKLWASKNPDLIRRYSRLSLSETRRPSYAVGRLMSQRSLIEFSFDHSEENPLEVLEDIFATFESKKYPLLLLMITLRLPRTISGGPQKPKRAQKQNQGQENHAGTNKELQERAKRNLDLNLELDLYQPDGMEMVWRRWSSIVEATLQPEYLHAKILRSVSQAGGKPPLKAEVSCFGVDLSALSSGGPPAVLEMMLAHVEMTGLYTEGIYRKSGSACKAKELHQLLESDYKKTRLDNYQIHTVTGLIKSWLRELPEPLMTFRLYNDFMYAAEIPERSERLRAIYRKLEELPAPNYGTLERLIFHLVRVAKEEPHNRMSGNALSIVFAPCILRSADMSDPLLSFKDLPKTTLCLEVLILEQMRRYEEKMKEIQQLEHAEALAIKELKLRRQNTILENPKDTLNVPPVDESVMDEEKTLMERIKSLKHEKNKLAYRLPELDQDASDNETLDSESIASLESPLDDSLVLEGRWNTKEPQKRPVQAGGGVRDGYVSTAMPASNQAVKPSGSVISLDIPYIDDDL
ncbi:unconventional myosin-IXb [Trichomycterus rosablanca]|uniref:unconventional myosin-IXb n=1 Tax=Trichomycterus rosablanca TaxID=2290929 RepID=UPI002F36071F